MVVGIGEVWLFFIVLGNVVMIGDEVMDGDIVVVLFVLL